MHAATLQHANVEVINLLKQQICSYVVELPNPTDWDRWFATFTGCYVNANGTKRYYKNGQVHRDGDLPAVICADGDKHYYKNGKFIK